MKKILITIGLLLTVIYLFYSFKSWYNSDYFRVVFFDVGQGDSALLITPGGETILIDGGPDRKVLRELGRVMPFWQRQIDLLIITHAHDDHVSGLIEINRRYHIKKVAYNNLAFDTPALNALIETFKENIISTMRAEAGAIFKFDNNCSLNILAATKEIQKDENDYSIVSLFNCLNKKILFTGDAGIAIENNLLSQNINLQADIIKIAHHGSLTASSLKFLQTVKPQAAVISVGEDNKFGHPSPIVLNRIGDLTVDIYRTDKFGSLEFLANYKSINVITK